jgi:hypothetical protein
MVLMTLLGNCFCLFISVFDVSIAEKKRRDRSSLSLSYHNNSFSISTLIQYDIHSRPHVTHFLCSPVFPSFSPIDFVENEEAMLNAQIRSSNKGTTKKASSKVKGFPLEAQEENPSKVPMRIRGMLFLRGPPFIMIVRGRGDEGIAINVSFSMTQPVEQWNCS